MLFDLRGRGRRRVIKVIYASLAILMGGGLVLFGIGGDVQGGLFDAFRGNQGNLQTGAATYRENRDEARMLVTRDPGNDEAWRDLVSAHSNLARTTEGYDPQQRAYDAEGRRHLADATRVFEEYRATDPDNGALFGETASLALRAYETLGNEQGVVDAAEIAAQARETPQSYVQFASYAFAAGQTRKGQLAGQRAIELAPRGERAELRQFIEQAEQQAAQQQAQEAQDTLPTPAPTEPPGETPTPAPDGE